MVDQIVALHSEEIALERQQETNAERIHELLVNLGK